jgi:hypothetical protein
MCSCGSQGATCCPGEDGGAPTCGSTGLTCAGISCSCVENIVAGYATNYVQRFDGTFWVSNSGAAYVPVQWPAGTGAPSAVAASGAATDQVTCGILGGAVWCFPTSGSTGNSVYLGAGLGPSVTTSSAVQVVTSVGVSPTPLAGAVQISGGATVPNFCVVTSDGSIWCWGYNGGGVLGRGDTADASYARQVLADASTPFADAVEVTVGYESACARKRDGTVWCWGDNTYAQLGTGSATPAQSPYPVKVSLLGSATRLVVRPRLTYCAIMQDTTGVCWGYDAYAQAGTPVPASMLAGPTSIVTSAGGTRLLGVLAVTSDDGANAMCASTSGSGLVCWGNAVQTAGGSRAPNPYPAVVYDPGTAAPVLGVGTAISFDFETSGMTYLNPYGLVVATGAGAPPASAQPACN